MTMLPMYRKCRKCGNIYSWNPDVGNIGCPKCGFSFMPGTGDTPIRSSALHIIEEILKKRK